LPDLLRRLEDETGVKWFKGEPPTHSLNASVKAAMSHPYLVLMDYTLSLDVFPRGYWGKCDPNKFVELVKAAVPKGD
jgi:hypothetical protein